MNELISVSLGILGTLLGVVLGFFAEPIEIYFQNKSKINHLRVALYKEMVQNYFILFQGLYEFRNNKAKNFFSIGSPLLGSDCYQFVISQETALFYQLKEARFMNTFYRLLTQVIALPNARNKIMGVSWDKFIEMIINLVTDSLSQGILDKKIFQKVSSKRDVEAILREAK
jgi:hypothetical protein